MAKEKAQHLFSQVSAPEELEIHFKGTTSFFGRGNPRLSISEAGEGCACSMLSDEADWDAATWDMRPTLLAPLTKSLTFISERAADGFILEALWAGDSSEKDVVISPDDLFNIVRQNRLETKTKYIVSPV